MKTQTALVAFHGHNILTINNGNAIRVAMKPICEAIGIDWEAQRKRIVRHPVMSQGASIMEVPSEGGIQQTWTLPLDMLNGWLFGVEASRVKPEIRERLVEYQRECFQVLHDYWTKGQATHAVPPVPTFPASLGRWMLSFDGKGKPFLSQIDAQEIVIDPDRLPEIINAPDSIFDDTLLLTRLAGACLGRLVPITPDPDDHTPQAPIPPDVQAALDCKAWMLSAEVHKIIHRYLRISVDTSCSIGYPERYIDQPKAMKVIAKTILDDALTPHNSALIMMEHMADHIAESAKSYADAVKAGTVALRKRGVVLGPVLAAAKEAVLSR